MGLSILLNVISILMLVFSGFFLVITRKWSIREIQRIEKKKREVGEVIESADQMIDELNRFSDYLIGNIEKKIYETQGLLVQIDDEIRIKKDLVHKKIFSQKQDSAKNNEDIITGSNTKTVIPFSNKNIAVNMKKLQVYSKVRIPETKPADQIINSNNKSRQIVQLAENGLNETEIAKRLNVGRGEIQLILGMKNCKTSKSTVNE